MKKKRTGKRRKDKGRGKEGVKRAQENKNKTKVKEELWPNSSYWQGHHSPRKLHMMALRAQRRPHPRLPGLAVFFANALATLTASPSFGQYVF